MPAGTSRVGNGIPSVRAATTRRPKVLLPGPGNPTGPVDDTLCEEAALEPSECP